jgi:8-oxo-dGTP pyrophosphatase MutT (NUDIX family)
VTAAPSPATRSVDDWLARFPEERPPVFLAGAAVTLVLREGAADVEVLLIERTERPEDPASGQVALPGGHVAESDGNLAVTAARELEEEVGVGLGDLRSGLHYVGTEHAIRFGLKVAVFAAALGPPTRAPFPHDIEEVAHVFWLPRETLLHTKQVARDTSRGIFPVPATVFEGHVVWGFTRRLLRQFFELPLEDGALGPAFPDRPGPAS